MLRVYSGRLCQLKAPEISVWGMVRLNHAPGSSRKRGKVSEAEAAYSLEWVSSSSRNWKLPRKPSDSCSPPPKRFLWE